MKFLLFSIVFIMVFSLPLLSQPGTLGGPPGNPVPITGLEYLLVAGGAYGAYRFSKKNRNKKTKKNNEA